MSGAAEVTGLDALTHGLGQLRADLPDALHGAEVDAADGVVRFVLSRIERRSGRAARTVRATATPAAVRIVGGGSEAPYYPWLDFGGRVGRKRSVNRPYRSEGRYIFAGLAAQRRDLAEAAASKVADAARRAGLGVRG